ncbi:T9SS type A sorting domain-containing protein, partial [candidate division KSB1 bacterium]|nr:T9SS type A sorting domain-containing protein [candidate division KSB1 bacterium]
VSMIKQQDTTAITMSRIPGLTTAFNGTHEFDAIGIYHVMTSAQPKYGVDTTVVREFTLSSFTPGTATTITSTNGDYLLLPAGGLDHETFVLSENIDENDEPVLNFSPQLTLAAPCQLTLHIDTNQFPDMHVAIYQKNGETWERRETTVDVENQIAHTEIEMLGSFKLQSESATNVSGNVPTSFLLEQNYPNPFNPKTRINYTIAKATSVEISVYNALGQKVNTLFAGKQEAGNYSVMWDGTNSALQVMPSGLYFYKLSSPEMTLVRKMVLLR